VDDLVWVSKDGEVMFLLSSSKTVYRSLDGGKTWADQTDALKHLHAQKFGGGAEPLPSPELLGVTSIVKSEHVLIFVGEHGMHVLSRDGGRSYVALWHPHTLGQVQPHRLVRECAGLIGSPEAKSRLDRIQHVIGHLVNVVQRPVSRRADPDRGVICRLVVGVGEGDPDRDSFRGIQESLQP
jgi:hypothetical protein